MRFLLFALMLSPVSEADDFFLEPYVGIGKIELHFESFTEVSNGFTLGGKFGWKPDKFFFGLDYQTAGPYKLGASMNHAEWNQNLTGVGMGAFYKIISFWVGYYPISIFDDSANSTTYDGSAIKGEVGLPAGRKLRTNITVIGYDVNTTGLRVVSTHVLIGIPLEL